jgi:glutamate racemase
MNSGETQGFPVNSSELPIGIFDSGIGGLTVLKEIQTVLPAEDTIYLGDTARVPYGIRSPETVTRYSFENTKFLVSKGIKILVVACNTVSSVSLEAIKTSITIPVVGVIEPGAKAAVAATRHGRIGVIGTDATIRSSAYAKAIKTLDGSIEVFGLACPLFVPLVEEGWTDGVVAELTAERYLKDLAGKGIDTLVLGCTHYPLLKAVLSKVMGDGVDLIDSAIETAREIKSILGALSLLNSAGGELRRFYVTDSPEKFVQVGERFLGKKIDYIRKIELESEV